MMRLREKHNGHWWNRGLPVVAGALVVVILLGCGGLLWMRQEIEQTARQIRQLESELVKEERRMRFLDSKLAEIHQPLYLERQIARLGLNLRPPASSQIVYLPAAPLQRPAREALAAGEAPVARDPFMRSIDLAIMEANLRAD
jgi:hypothetical protein